MKRPIAISRRHLVVAAVLAATMALASTEVAAQPGAGPPNALQGFSKNRGEPVKIQAAALEVRDKQKMATFSGDVHLVQGDTDMRCKVLVVYYEGDAANPGQQTQQTQQTQPARQSTQPKQANMSDQSGGGAQQQIKRMEARGDVIVVQKDQTATGDRGDFDMRGNTVTLTGNVVVAKGENILRGQKLVVNLTSGVSRMESQGGRVEGLFKSSAPPPSENSPRQSNRN